MKTNNFIPVRIFLSIIIVLLSVSCGIDSYSYLPPVSTVNSTLNSLAVIRLPGASDVITMDFSTGKTPTMSIANQSQTLGTDYEIFYRIYLSDKMEATVNTTAIRSTVNPTLASDWTALEPYTVDSNNLSSSVLTAFTSRKYYTILTDSSGNLIRSNGNGAFNPKPADRLFVTSDDLVDKSNISAEINADIQDKSDMTGAAQYVYTSMYIVMRGFDTQTLNPYYSAPTFINVFMLPVGGQSVPVTGVSVISVSPQTTGPAVKLAATVSPSNATNKGVTWSVDPSSNASIRPLENNTAIIYSLVDNTGNTVTVTVTTTDSTYTSISYTANISVTLSGIAATGISIDASSPLTLSPTETVSLYAIMTPSTAVQTVTWSSDNKSIAEVDPNGLVKANAVGTAVITAETTDGTELRATREVTVQ
ncbi:MAG: Ig-like domain-containing protein [Spirochaetaceae bacterium]|jgi:uncharacterized protein YjdB|nr:Ig-like domain-containing protein [Spirochaetaceae bacterium]